MTHNSVPKSCLLINREKSYTRQFDFSKTIIEKKRGIPVMDSVLNQNDEYFIKLSQEFQF